MDSVFVASSHKADLQFVDCDNFTVVIYRLRANIPTNKLPHSTTTILATCSYFNAGLGIQRMDPRRTIQTGMCWLQIYGGLLKSAAYMKFKSTGLFLHVHVSNVHIKIQ